MHGRKSCENDGAHFRDPLDGRESANCLSILLCRSGYGYFWLFQNPTVRFGADCELKYSEYQSLRNERNKTTMASEEDSLLLRDNGSRLRQSSRAAWKKNIHMGAILVLSTTFAFVAGLLFSNWRSIQTNKESASATVKQRYRATQFISFTINTLGGLDAHGGSAYLICPTELAGWHRLYPLLLMLAFF
jgi:hypothetical protein